PADAAPRVPVVVAPQEVAMAAKSAAASIAIEIAGVVAGRTRRICRMAGGSAARREGGDMIAVPAAIRVLVARKPIDFRKGADGLAALNREVLGHDPFCGAIYVFRANRGWCCSGNGSSIGRSGSRRSAMA